MYDIAAKQAASMLATTYLTVERTKAGHIAAVAAARYTRSAAHDAYHAAVRVIEQAPGTAIAATAARDAAETAELAAFLAYLANAETGTKVSLDRMRAREDQAVNVDEMATAAEAAVTAPA